MSKEVYINARFLTQTTTGVQRFAIEIAKKIHQLNPSIKFIAPGNVVHPAVAKELGVISIGFLKGHLWEQIELPIYLMKKGNPLLINFCNTAPLMYKNKIVSIHDLAFIVNPKWFSKPFAFFYNFLIPKIAKSAKHVITVSNSSKNELIAHFGIEANKVSVVYNGITFKTFSAEKQVKSLLTSTYFLTVSSFDPRKNLQKLIEAFIAWNPKDLKLVVIGGKNNNFSEASITAHDSIVALGYVSDQELIHYYQHAICFVYPSLYEGFGLPPLEALALGTNVIASDIPSIREVCNDSILQYFDPNNTESIIAALRFASEHTFTEPKPIDFGKFSWDKAANAVNEIIKVHN
jgi:glycosyltransferase involved in cell wall biosynthesis